MDLLAAAGSVAVAWLLYGALFTGMGLALVRALGLRTLTAQRLWLAFWLGFALSLATLQLWHFGFAVDARPLALMAPLAAYGLVAFRLELASLGRRALGRPWLLLGLGVCVLWCADRAIAPGIAQDSGLYHYPVVRWNNTYPVVPGLGNLSLRLAYNNGNLLYTALLNVGPFAERGQHLANGLLVAAFLAGTLAAGARWLGARSREPEVDLFLLLLFPVGVNFAVSKGMSSPTTDLSLALVIFVAASRVLALATSRPADGEAAQHARTLDLATVALLTGMGVCIKLSGAMLCLLLWLVGCGLWLARHRPPQRELRTVVLAAALSASLVGPWIARGYVLSGYPLFPSTLAPLPFDWRVPAAIPDHARARIQGFGRMDLAWFIYRGLAADPRTMPIARAMGMPTDPDAPVTGIAWLRPWAAVVSLYTPVEVAAPLALAGGTGVAALLRRRRRPEVAAEARPDDDDAHAPRPAAALAVRSRADTLGRAALFLAPTVGIVFWFVNAPEPRFGTAAAWLLGGTGCALLLARAGTGARRAVVLGVVALASVALVQRAALNHLQRGDALFSDVPFVRPGPDGGFYPLPEPRLRRFRTGHGLSVLIPRHSTLTNCWGAPLPCAAKERPELAARDPEDLGAGFQMRPSP